MAGPSHVTLSREAAAVVGFFTALSFLLLSVADSILVVAVTVVFAWILFRKDRMDLKAAELLKVFQLSDASAAVDTKLRYLNDIKSDIKHKSVPDTAVANIFEVIRRSIASSASQQLMVLAFSTLSNFLKRLHGQGQANVIGFHGHKLYYTLLIEKLSDQRDNVRVSASKAFSDFWLYVSPEARFEIEHNIIQNVLSGKNPRPKVTSLQWLSDMVKNHGLKVRSYVPLLITCLEDADGAVRDAAKATVIQLFKGASSRALTDLTKQLRLRNVRKSITDAIMTEVAGSHEIQPDLESSVIVDSPITSTIETTLPARPHTRAELQRPQSVMSSRHPSRTEASNMVAAATPATSASHVHSTHLATPTFNAELDTIQVPKRSNRSIHTRINSDPTEIAGGLPVDPLTADLSDLSHPEIPLVEIKLNDSAIERKYVDTHKDLDELIMSTRPHFEGRESEQNWLKREQSINLLRQITRGNAPLDHRLTYCGDMYILVEGILKAVNSLRTTLSTTGCELIREMCKAVGHGIDTMAEILLQDLIKLCAATKKISQNNGNLAVDAIFASVTVSHRIVNHIWQAVQDKNVQPRSFAAGWLQTLMQSHRQGCNRTGCLDLIEKSIKRALDDSNPAVRTNMRSTYWTFAAFWPDKAQSIMSTLDAKSQNLLQQDPSNPSKFTGDLTKSTSTRVENVRPQVQSKKSLKDFLANQKKMAQQNKKENEPPARPASAMSTMPDIKLPNRPAVRPPPVPSTTASHTSSSLATSQSGSLSSAPMRPPVRPNTTRKVESTRAAPQDAQQRTNTDNMDTVTITARNPRPVQADQPSFKPSIIPSPVKPVLKSTQTSPAKQQIPIPTATKPPISPPKPKKQPTVTKAVANSDKAKISSFNSTTSASSAATSPATITSGPQLENDPPISPTKRASMLPHLKFDSPIVRKRSDEDIALPIPRKDRPLSGDSIYSRTSTSGIPRPVQNHSRQDSDELSQPSETVKVYEDPFVSAEAMQTVVADPTISKTTGIPPFKILEDLPINRNDGNIPFLPEAFRPDSPLRGEGKPNLQDKIISQRRWDKAELSRPIPIRPNSKDRTVNQNTLQRYIDGIRNRTIDVLGFRKLQGIIYDHDDIFEDEVLFDDLVLTLFDLIASPSDGPRAPLGRTHDRKEQAISTIKQLFRLLPQYVKTYCPRALSALIIGRRYFNSNSHIVSGIESTADMMLRECSPSDAIEAVLDVLTLEVDKEAAERSMVMGLGILTGLLLKSDETVVASQYEERLASLARVGLSRGHPATRRAVVEYCKVLNKYIRPESRFYALVAGGAEEVRSLLTYYVAVGQ